MLVLKAATWFKIARDFNLIFILKKLGFQKSKLYNILRFRMNQNEDFYEIFIGIRDYSGKFIVSTK